MLVGIRNRNPKLKRGKTTRFQERGKLLFLLEGSSQGSCVGGTHNLLKEMAAAAHITAFDVTYKNNMAAIGFHKAFSAEDSSRTCDVMQGTKGGFVTNMWYQQDDATPVVDVDVVYGKDEPAPAGFEKLGKTLAGGLEEEGVASYLCFRRAEETKDGDYVVTDEMLAAGEGPLISLRIALTEDEGLEATMVAEGYAKEVGALGAYFQAHAEGERRGELAAAPPAPAAPKRKRRRGGPRRARD